MTVVDETGARKRMSEYRLEDAKLDGVLDEWPAEPPKQPKTAVETTRLALIGSPGQVHRLAWKFSDVGRASKLAASFKRPNPLRSTQAPRGPSMLGRSSIRPSVSGGWQPAISRPPSRRRSLAQPGSGIASAVASGHSVAVHKTRPQPVSRSSRDEGVMSMLKSIPRPLASLASMARLGSWSPVSSRAIAGWLMPSRRANAVWDRLLCSR